jgi:hypothetical protein
MKYLRRFCYWLAMKVLDPLETAWIWAKQRFRGKWLKK